MISQPLTLLLKPGQMSTHQTCALQTCAVAATRLGDVQGSTAAPTSPPPEHEAFLEPLNTLCARAACKLTVIDGLSIPSEAGGSMEKDVWSFRIRAGMPGAETAASHPLFLVPGAGALRSFAASAAASPPACPWRRHASRQLPNSGSTSGYSHLWPQLAQEHSARAVAKQPEGRLKWTSPGFLAFS